MAVWANLWSFATAAGTLALAGATYAIIRQGKQQRQDAERQHRDRLKPVCVLVPIGGVDPLNRRGELLERRDPSPDNPSFGILAIHCVLQNVGTGPALNLRIKLRFLDMHGWTTEPWELSPLGAGEIRGGENAPLLIPIRIHDGFNVTDFAQVTGKPWEIWLEYQDVFGKRFQSIHSKSPVDMNPTTFGWTTPAPGEQPKAIMRTIPWLTYREDVAL